MINISTVSLLEKDLY